MQGSRDTLQWSFVRPFRAHHLRIRPLLLQSLFLHEAAGDVVLGDIADVGDGLTTDFLGSDQLDIVEPAVGIQSALLGLLAQPADTCSTRVLGRQGEQHVVCVVHRLVLVVAVQQQTDVLHAGVNIRLRLLDVADRELVAERGALLVRGTEGVQGGAQLESVLANGPGALAAGT